MSMNLQNVLRSRSSIPNTTRNRQRYYDELVYTDKYIMAQMTIERELSGHSGCVNTLDWSKQGNKLLSGSDDKTLNIYDACNDFKLLTTIETGHRANIFTAKFMPKTNENIIVSGAGDSEVRIFDLQQESILREMYVCHSDQIKKVCYFEDNPNEFLTCSQDGTVRHFDLRVQHICSPHQVKSFITGQERPCKQHPIPKADNLNQGCEAPIIDYGKHNIEFNSMSINKANQHYIALCGMSDYLYLHDLRMPAKSIKKFSPTRTGRRRPLKHITACQFSQSNELIGSWSSDGIYLFDIHESGGDNSSNSCSSISTGISSNISSNTHNNQDRELIEVTISSDEDDDDDDDDDDEYARIMDVFSREARNTTTSEQSEDDSDDDAVADLAFEAFASRISQDSSSVFDTDMEIVKPKRKYTGHCNIETVKDVDFYGPNDEFIVSGSDRGHLFIWDKKTSKIVQLFEADNEVVNVAKGHPYLPYLAVSGIDSTIKILKPTSRLRTTKQVDIPSTYSTSSRLYEKDEIISANKEANRTQGGNIYLPPSTYTALLRLERQRRLFMLAEEFDIAAISSFGESTGSSDSNTEEEEEPEREMEETEH